MGTFGRCALWLTVALAAVPARGAEALKLHSPVVPLPDLTKERTMNGIDPALAADFWKTWTQVSVRFRQDNGEQRFIYANDVAWQAIKAGMKTYPNGAMFAKIAFKTVADPAFPSSLEPRNFSRIQLMLKDPAHHGQTGGWGYALYLADKTTTASDDGTEVACHACHQLVQDRDFVFSHASFLGAGATTAEATEAPFSGHFQPKPQADLPPFSRSVLQFFKVQAAEVRYFSMPLFTGSLDESIGPLIAAATTGPYLLADNDGRRFLLVSPSSPTPDCQNALDLFESSTGHSARKRLDGSAPPTHPILMRGRVCGGKVEWQKMRPMPTALR